VYNGGGFFFPVDLSTIVIVPHSRIAEFVSTAAALLRVERYICILDEVDTFVNPKADYYSYACILAHKSKVCWGLTASPVHNKLENTYYFVGVVFPNNPFGTVAGFYHTYVVEETITVRNPSGKPWSRFMQLQQVVEYKNLDSFQSVLSSISASCSMDSIIHFKFLTCSLSEDEKIRYSAVGAEAYSSKARASYFSRLHNAADMPVAGDELSTKEQLLLSLVETIAKRGNPFIIYTAYIPTKDRIAYVMSKAGIPYMTITGASSDKERARIANSVKVGEVCCIILTDAGLRGINLQACETTIAYHIPFNILGIIQLLGRQCRIGSSYKENFFFFTIAQGTIDEYREQYMRRNIPLVKAAMSGSSVILPDISDAHLTKKDLEFMRGSMLWGNSPAKPRKKSKSSTSICHV
jgi:hypothetical protein